MAKHGAGAKPADTRIDGPINDGATNEVTATIETIQAFASEIAQMSEQAFVRTNQHLEKLRKAHGIDLATAIRADFLQEAMEHAVQHTRKYIEMRATFPNELAQPVNPAVEAAVAARHGAVANVGRLPKVARKA